MCYDWSRSKGLVEQLGATTRPGCRPFQRPSRSRAVGWCGWAAKGNTCNCMCMREHGMYVDMHKIKYHDARIMYTPLIIMYMNAMRMCAYMYIGTWIYVHQVLYNGFRCWFEHQKLQQSLPSRIVRITLQTVYTSLSYVQSHHAEHTDCSVADRGAFPSQTGICIIMYVCIYIYI